MESELSENSKRLRRQWQRVVCVLLLACCLGPLHLSTQSKPAAAPSQTPVSLADSLRHSQGKEIHIFYIHGIGSDGPDDYDSLGLRKSICEYLKDCTSEAGSPTGPWDYANQDQFKVDAPVPRLEYMDEPVWKSQEEWHAAAPYAVHFQLARSGAPSIYIDELNWWPLTFALKCRQIVASDAAFVAPSKMRIETCSRRVPNPGVPLRFKSYDWINKEDATRLLKLPSNGARANRALKNGLMDWGFSDAAMVLGPLRPYVLSAIRQLILKSISDAPESKGTDPTHPRMNQEFVIVSHSLGSYLIFSALDIDPATSQTIAFEQSGNSFEQILARTSLVYFFANQLRLLELASLDGATDRNLATHLEAWGKIRCDYLKSLSDSNQQCQLPRITALNDPSDLLTWTVPPIASVEVVNYSVKNARSWLWLIENPTPAHNNYAKDKRAIEDLLNSGSETKK
jgi:hypothetical protein